ncbi:MAG: hypothetical protein R2834_07205 [Rhodothermales bacterium]
MRNCTTYIRTSLLVLSILGFLAIRPMAAQAQLQVGAGLAFGTEIEKIGLQLNANLPVAQEGKIRGAADVIFFLKDDFGSGSTRLWTINLNGHYIFMTTEEFLVYALGGINIANYTIKSDFDIPEIPGFGFDASSTELGLNVGAGGEYGMPFGNLYGEVKYVLSDFDQLVISAGIRIPIGGSR